MKNEHLIGYYCGKAARAALGLALLLTLLLLLASCGESSTTNSTNSSQAPASAPTITNNNLTLSQAQQQAGYHLLSISSSLAGYTLKRVNAFGPTGHQVYSLYYTMGKDTITITEGKSLEANQLGNSKTNVSLRGTTGTLSGSKGVTVLSWAEKGVNISITGALTNTQMIALAKSLV